MVHLPAPNTPQFDWVLCRACVAAPQPVPIYQPEVATRAVVAAADRPQRREYWVGGSTVAAILGNRIIPGLLDRYLGRTGYKSQQTDEPADPDRPANLWTLVDGRQGRDHGAHGSFDDRAHPCSAQAWLSQHRQLAAARRQPCHRVGADRACQRQPRPCKEGRPSSSSCSYAERPTGSRLACQGDSRTTAVASA